MSTQATSPAKSLFDLPPEVRQLIYSFLFPDNYVEFGILKGTPPQATWKNQSSATLSILLSCRQVYQECYQRAYRNTTFHLSPKPQPDKAQDVGSPKTRKIAATRVEDSADHLRSARPETRSLIRHIAVCSKAHKVLKEDYTLFRSDGVAFSPILPNVTQIVLRDEVESYPGMIDCLVTGTPHLQRIFFVLEEELVDRRDPMTCYTPPCLRESKFFPDEKGFVQHDGLHLFWATHFKTDGEKWFESVRGTGPQQIDHWRAFGRENMTACAGVLPDGDLGQVYGACKHVHVVFDKVEGCRQKMIEPWENKCPSNEILNGFNGTLVSKVCKDEKIWISR